MMNVHLGTCSFYWRGDVPYCDWHTGEMMNRYKMCAGVCGMSSSNSRPKSCVLRFNWYNILVRMYNNVSIGCREMLRSRVDRWFAHLTAHCDTIHTRFVHTCVPFRSSTVRQMFDCVSLTNRINSTLRRFRRSQRTQRMLLAWPLFSGHENEMCVTRSAFDWST